MNALQHRLIVHNDTDIINARMAVREFARECGFSSRDQACISLVSASVASLLKLGKDFDFDVNGIEILMEHCSNGDRDGVRVSCIKQHTKMGNDEVNHGLKSSFLLVDDVQMHPLSIDGIEVILTKWGSSHKG